MAYPPDTPPSPLCRPFRRLPAPFCPPTSPPAAVTALRHRWLLANLPVIVQPRFDVANGNGLLAVFYHFDDSSRCCILSLVFQSEASYEVSRADRLNRFGSFLYRSHNYRLYRRTADIDHLAFHGIALQGQRGEDDVGGWELLHSTDFGGLQQWSKGAKGHFLLYYSLMQHYDVELKAAGWRQWHGHGHDSDLTMQPQLEQWRQEDEAAQRVGLTAEQRLASIAAKSRVCSPPLPHRPVVYVVTQNHLFAPYDTNPQLHHKLFHHSYPVLPGDRAVAETFAQLCVRTAWTLFSFIPSWLYSPLDRRMRKQRQHWWAHMHRSRMLDGAADAPHRRQQHDDDGSGETVRLEGKAVAVIEACDI